MEVLEALLFNAVNEADFSSQTALYLISYSFLAAASAAIFCFWLSDSIWK